jgi:uncharacterized membrane protein
MLWGMSTQDDVRRLEREFADAMQRLYSVGNGLARLRADLEPASVPAAGRTGAGPVPAVGAGASALRVETAGAVPAPPAAAARGVAPVALPRVGAPPPPPAPPAVPWYRREGAVTWVLAVAGTVVTLAGVAMLLVLAVRQGWFGPAARVTSGAALALVLGVLGARGGSRDVAQGRGVGSAPVALVATGGAAAYLDVVAVTAAYGWVPSVVGLVLSGLVAVAGLWLARRWKSELLAVLMVAGAAGFSPLVAGGAGWVLSAFLGILSLAGWWAAAGRTYPVLTVVRSVPVTVSLLAAAVADPGEGERLGLLAVAIVVLLATLATVTLDGRRDPGDATASLSLAVATVGLLVVTGAQPDPLRPVLHVLTAAVLFLAASSSARAPIGPLPAHLVATSAVGASVSAVLAVVSGAPDGFVVTGLLLLAGAHLTAAGVTRSRVTLGLGAGVGTLALLGWLQHPLAVLTPAEAATHDLRAALLDSLLAGAVAGLGVWATSSVRGLGSEPRLAAVVLGWVVGLGASATAFVSMGTILGARLGDARLGFTAGHAAATVLWMLAAGWLLLHSLGQGRLADLALRSGLLLAAVAVAKLFLYDLAALSGVVRSVGFIATGLVLLATGSRYARAHERGRISG